MVAVPRAWDATIYWLSMINATFEPVPFKGKILQAVRVRNKAATGCKHVGLLTFGCSNQQRFLPTVGFRAFCQTLAKLTHVGLLGSSLFTPLPNIWISLQTHVSRWAGSGHQLGDRSIALASLLLALLIGACGEVLSGGLWILSGRHQVLVLVELRPALHSPATVPSLTPAKLPPVLLPDFPGK